MKLRMDSNNNRNIRIIVMTVLKITHKINYMKRERRGGKIHRQRQRQTVRQTNSQEDIQRKKHRRQEKKTNTEKGKK